MTKSLEKLNAWISEQVVYTDDGLIDSAQTIKNYLSVCGETGSIEVKRLAEEVSSKKELSCLGSISTNISLVTSLPV